MFIAKIINTKGETVEAKARMRYAVYVKMYYGNKIVAMFENMTGAQAWRDKYWSVGGEVVPLVRDDDDHVAGYPTTPTANAEALKKMEDS